MTDVRDVQAALERGKAAVLVVPPAPEQAEMVWDLIHAGLAPGVSPAAVIVCADAASATDWVAAAPADRRLHPVTGLGRTARLLKEGGIDVLAGDVKDLAFLVARAALKLESVPTLVLAWPESILTGEHAAALDTLLAEARDARRVILSWNPGLLGDFLERQAHRAPVFGNLPIGENARPLPPIGPARYAVVTAERRLGTLRDTLDALNPARAFVWTPNTAHADRLRTLLGTSNVEVVIDTAPREATFDAVICPRLPSREQFAALSKMAEPVVLISACQLPYLKSIAGPLQPLKLPTAADRARDRTEALRTQVAELLEMGSVDAELAVLDPLFERFDPAEVAAALLAITRQPSAVSQPTPDSRQPIAPPWVKLFLSVGKKDRAGAKDIVGALIKEVKVDKGDIGRIDVRETFSVVEIAPHAAEAAIRGLSGVAIRGRRVAARRDREA
ncbi:MAG: DbpA RNA binding domain-containing protein [Gemmatimonadetes bacterium]|nr:DbpA RNA binding domain-containing protein [Gemmatimonadota bacterium]